MRTQKAVTSNIATLGESRYRFHCSRVCNRGKSKAAPPAIPKMACQLVVQSQRERWNLPALLNMISRRPHSFSAVLMALSKSVNLTKGIELKLSIEENRSQSVCALHSKHGKQNCLTLMVGNIAFDKTGDWLGPWVVRLIELLCKSLSLLFP